MKRILLYLLAVVLIVAGLFLLLQLYNQFRPKQNGALQVTANIVSRVYLDGEHVGDTPFCRGDIALCKGGEGTVSAGEHTIKIVPHDTGMSEYTIKAEVLPNVMTAVDRTFLPDGLSSAYILTLEKNNSGSELFVQSIPSGAIVSIDGVSGGVTPFTEHSISPSEHVIEIQKDGFAKKTIRVRTVDGYTLVVNVILGAAGPDEVEPTPEEEEEASASAQVRILETPTGFLRVRSGPGTGNQEVTTVEPGATFVILTEENGWIEIQIDETTRGWISEEFAEKVVEEEDGN